MSVTRPSYENVRLMCFSLSYVPVFSLFCHLSFFFSVRALLAELVRLRGGATSARPVGRPAGGGRITTAEGTIRTRITSFICYGENYYL